ncbi:single-stranded-DNA-specific exonuclease RecJ [Pontiella agarivorans]|uniref:Single-stranded-DNA-specific exonuclease RecJ n=1 Tax=Pontiella agarivorans TaxID=3038953 RepID=A0ABU5MSN7_9BACT|nr:single-stranded-DNA-specific exonuclease RecJ [Pontiella agarivorans]MDZ8117142.1 single-stranded-DNA-specific exonuclease RecJ [Pontiella agarivorans]
MSFSFRHWKIRPVDEETVRKLSLQSELPLPLARVLALRGFHTPEMVERFLHPKLSGLSDPFLLPDMEKAVSRLWKAFQGGEIITVFGDYDVDGVTSAALLTRIFVALGANVKPFIPDRLDEGYGLSVQALERCISEHGSSVVVSVDCGVNSVDSVRMAQTRGVDVIVTDHHEPGEETAPAFALINPKLGTVKSLEMLSGVGVAFKLAHALVKRGRELGDAAAAVLELREYLDIVSLGTVADIVPLREENRILVRHGLTQLARTRWPGLEALKNVAGVKGELETYHLGFQLGPRINASGRIGQPMEALSLLITPDSAQAQRIARVLDETNAERRKIEREMADAAFEEIDTYFDPEKHFGLVVAREGWHPGVVGIVASRVSRHYNRPAIIMGIEEEGHARGSCRSIAEYNMLDGLQACADLLSKFGGHKMAAGLEVKPGKLDDFKEQFNRAVFQSLENVDLTPVQPIDAVLEPRDVNQEFYCEMKKLRPFGQDNPEPVWAMEKMSVSGSPRVVGENHLKLSLVSKGCKFDAIAFNFPLEDLPPGRVDVAFVLKENCWMGNTTLQLQVLDIRPTN